MILEIVGSLVELLTPLLDVSLDASISDATLQIYDKNTFDSSVKDFAVSGLIIAILTTIGMMFLNFVRTRKCEILDMAEGVYGISCVGMNAAILFVLSDAYTQGKDGEWDKISPMFTSIAMAMAVMCICYILTVSLAAHTKPEFLTVKVLCYSIDLVFMFSQILLFAILLVTMYNCMEEPMYDDDGFSTPDHGYGYGYGHNGGGGGMATPSPSQAGTAAQTAGSGFTVDFGCKNGTEGDAASAISSAAAVVGFFTKVIIPVGIKIYELKNKGKDKEANEKSKQREIEA